MRPSSLRVCLTERRTAPMNETLLDYAINPTPYPIQASPSTGDPNLASLTLVVSDHSGDIITCSGTSLSFTPGTNAEDFCSDPTGISSSPQTGWSVQQQSGPLCCCTLQPVWGELEMPVGSEQKSSAFVPGV